MTTEEIVKIGLAALVGAFIKPIVEAFMPSKESIKSYVMKGLIIFGSYGIPIWIIVQSLFDESPLNKLFVFKIVFFTILILFHFTLDYFSKLLLIMKEQIDELYHQNERINKSENFMLKHVGATQEIISTQRELVEIVKEIESKPKNKKR